MLYHAASLLTLISLFILGPAFGRAILLTIDKRQTWPQSKQHVALGLCMMAALAVLIGIYGVVWKISPRSVVWYTWLSSVPIDGSVSIPEGVSVDISHEPVRVTVEP
jgi:hypothetical protein